MSPGPVHCCPMILWPHRIQLQWRGCAYMDPAEFWFLWTCQDLDFISCCSPCEINTTSMPVPLDWQCMHAHLRTRMHGHTHTHTHTHAVASMHAYTLTPTHIDDANVCLKSSCPHARDSQTHGPEAIQEKVDHDSPPSLPFCARQAAQ